MNSFPAIKAILILIAGMGCTNYTSGDCWQNNRKPFSINSAESVCDACLAQEALRILEDDMTPPPGPYGVVGQ